MVGSAPSSAASDRPCRGNCLRQCLVYDRLPSSAPGPHGTGRAYHRPAKGGVRVPAAQGPHANALPFAAGVTEAGILLLERDTGQPVSGYRDSSGVPRAPGHRDRTVQRLLEQAQPFQANRHGLHTDMEELLIG